MLVVAGHCHMRLPSHAHICTWHRSRGTGGGQEEREVKKVRNRGIDRESKRRDRDMTVGFKRGISVRAYKEQNSRETESKDPQRKVRK